MSLRDDERSPRSTFECPPEGVDRAAERRLTDALHGSRVVPLGADPAGSPTGPQRRSFPTEPGQWAVPLDVRTEDSAAAQALAWIAVLLMGLATVLLTTLADIRAVDAGFRQSPRELLLPFLGLLALGVVGDGLRERSRDDEVELSFTAVILMGAIPLLGPVPAVVLGPLITVLSPLANRLRAHTGAASGLPHRTLLVLAVNSAMTAFLTSASAWVYLAAGGVGVESAFGGTTPLFVRVAFPMLLADVTFTVLNAVLVVCMIAWSSPGSVRAFMTGALPLSMTLFLGYGVIAFLFVVLWGPVGLGAVALGLILAPLLISRWSYREYVEENEVHRRLLEALAVSGELRRNQVNRPYRISRVCEAVASEMGLSGRDHDILRDASALHDVGTVAVPWHVLEADPTTLDDDELDRLASHPRVSHDLLSGIDFLEDSAEAVLHHHERYDGLGYPLGLARTEIPIASRVLACADVAEALGQQLPHTAEGRAHLLEALRAEAGTILDPDVVEATVAVLGSSRGNDLFADLMLRESAHTDARNSHALPVTSDLLAARRSRRGMQADREARP